jgi:hypothetical protein
VCISTAEVWEDDTGFHGGLVVVVATAAPLVATITMDAAQETMVAAARIYAGGSYNGGGNSDM